MAFEKIWSQNLWRHKEKVTDLNLRWPGGHLKLWTFFRCLVSVRPLVKLDWHTWQMYLGSFRFCLQVKKNISIKYTNIWSQNRKIQRFYKSFNFRIELFYTTILTYIKFKCFYILFSSTVLPQVPLAEDVQWLIIFSILQFSKGKKLPKTIRTLLEYNISLYCGNPRYTFQEIFKSRLESSKTIIRVLVYSH